MCKEQWEFPRICEHLWKHNLMLLVGLFAENMEE